MPTIVIAHTFCAFLDTRVFYGFQVVLTNTEIFLRCLKVSGKRGTQEEFLLSKKKKKNGGNYAFSSSLQ